MQTPNGVDDPRMAKALCRYEIISRYLALKPKRGLKKKLLKKLSEERWLGPDGTIFMVSAETIRAWARRYRRSGLTGLMDKERPKRGVSVLTEEQQKLVCDLKEDVPGRSLERIISIAEETNLVEKDVLKRSTVHRVLQAKGLSKRRLREPDTEDLDRFEADYPNDLWQSDMLVGPWLPNPDCPGKVRRAKLFLFMDDHSRRILHGRFSFDEGLPYMELVFRRAVQKYGLPKRVYFDNGKVYRSNHVRHIVAELSIHRVVHTQKYRPYGHGKVEKLNEKIRAAFLDELQASNINTLDELNEAFVAWYEQDYNAKIHGTTFEPPKARWEAEIEGIQFVDEEKLRQAFLWTETRTTDGTGIFSLFGVKYQAGAGLGKRRLQIRYDPDTLHEVEVWRNGEFIERVKPFSVSTHRRPKADTPPPLPKREPVVDYLSHLVDERKKNGISEPTPKVLVEKAKEKREMEIQRVIALLDDRLEHGVVDSGEVRRFMDKFRPFDLDLAELALDEMLESGVEKDLPVSVYLGAMRDAAKGAMQ